jgi:hypothetical protein
MTAISEDRLFDFIIKGSLVLLAVLAIGSMALFSGKVALGILAGGTIAIVNFLWMRNVLQRIMGLLPANANRFALVRYIGRLAATAFCLYLVITSGWFSLTGVLVGLSIIVIIIVILSLYCALSTGG